MTRQASPAFASGGGAGRCSCLASAYLAKGSKLSESRCLCDYGMGEGMTRKANVLCPRKGASTRLRFASRALPAPPSHPEKWRRPGPPACRVGCAGADQVRLDERELWQPLSRQAPTLFFVCNMLDLFLETFPTDWTDRHFAVMAMTPLHHYQILTKRAERMQPYVADLRTPDSVAEAMATLPKTDFRQKLVLGPFDWPLPNVSKGVSTETQAWADRRFPYLLDTRVAPSATSFAVSDDPEPDRPACGSRPAVSPHLDSAGP
jgi:hypothetical protein